MTLQHRTKPCENPKCDKQCIERDTENEILWKRRRFHSNSCGAKARRMTTKICSDPDCLRGGVPQILKCFPMDAGNADGHKDYCGSCSKRKHDEAEEEAALTGIPKFMWIMAFWSDILKEKNKRNAAAIERRAGLRVAR